MKRLFKNKLCLLVLCIVVVICSIYTGLIVVKALTSVPLYDIDGNRLIVSQYEIGEYKGRGWYEEPVQKMYDIDNNMKIVKKRYVEDYKKSGWYEEPMITVYAPQNQELLIKKSEKDTYLSSGWYESKEEADFNGIDKVELELLARTIHAEAADNNYLDRCYAGMVVMNRKNCGLWGNTIQSVISAPGQYACYRNKKFNSPIPDECYKIAIQIMLGETFGVPYNVIFQSGGKQGTGIWKIVYNTSGYNNYYCYGNI